MALVDGALTVERAALRACDGVVTASGRLDLRDARRPPFALRVAARGADLRAALAGTSAAGRLDGHLALDADLAGSGLAWDAVAPTLRGTATVDVRDGAMRDANLVREVLDAVRRVPGLGAVLGVPARSGELLAAKDTRFDALGAHVRIAERRLTTEDFAFDARDYRITGRGVLAFDRALDFTGTLALSEPFARAVLPGAAILRTVGDPLRLLRIPFRASGTLPRVTVVPDAGAVVRPLDELERGAEALLGGTKRGRKLLAPLDELLRRSPRGGAVDSARPR
ncbi:MAG TPA: AsmA-like C-terminal region-containing protein [Candidatus Binatia bacterium]|nr:AsmA-like C-terminal region-containing protein [Candidatus Binatia bacterium]